MKESILVIANNKYEVDQADTILHSAGFEFWKTWRLGGNHPCESLNRSVRSDGTVLHNQASGKKQTTYLARDLTLEIALTFPGAKMPKPKGPFFDDDGREYVIDGDEKRMPVGVDKFIHFSENTLLSYPDQYFSNATGGPLRWILKPKVTPVTMSEAIEAVAKQRGCSVADLELVK